MSTQERPLRILSLDGGGVRGLSSIITIKHIMSRVNDKRGPDDHLEPCQIFDMIGGTSTGGIIAIMLGRLRMKISDCEDAYLQLSEKIFTPKRSKSNWPGQAKDFLQAESRFDAKALEDAIKRSITELEDGDEDENMLLKDPGGSCRVFVVTTRENNSELAVFRSYRISGKELFFDECKVWEACRATSAATTFFDPIKIGKYGQRFIDGGLLYNNPIDIAFREAEAIWPGRDTLILSIGTGSAPGMPFAGNLKTVVERMKNIVTQTERTANDFYQNHPSLVANELLFRFNVDHNLSHIGLNKYGEIPKIADATEAYLTRGEIDMKLSVYINKLLTSIPKDLVGVRPARVRKPSVPISALETSSRNTLYPGVERTRKSQETARQKTGSKLRWFNIQRETSQPPDKSEDSQSVPCELLGYPHGKDPQAVQAVNKSLSIKRGDGGAKTPRKNTRPTNSPIMTEKDLILVLDSKSPITSAQLISISEENFLSTASSISAPLDPLHSATLEANVTFVNAAKTGDTELLLAWISQSCIRSKLVQRSINNALIELSKNIAPEGRGLGVLNILFQYCNPDLECKDTKYGCTPLIWAVYFRRIVIAELLISKGACLEAVDMTYERTPLLWAAFRGPLKATELILEHSREQQLICAKDKDGNTALTLAYAEKHMLIVKILLHNGADPNLNIKPGTPLLISAIEEGDDDLVHLLVAKGADVDCLRLDGVPALSVAVYDKSSSMIQLLINNGANIQASDPQGRTPLIWAIKRLRGDIVELLINRGADKDVADSDGLTAQYWAQRTRLGKIISLVHQKG